MSSRLSRFLNLIKEDLEHLPDLPLPPEPEPDPVSDPEKRTTTIVDVPSTIVQSDCEANKPALKSLIIHPQPETTDPETQVICKRFVWLTDPNKRSPSPSNTKPDQSLRPLLNLQHGQVGPAEESYCPILEISKYCYKYIRGDDSQRVATRFFDAGKFWARDWDL